MRKCPPYANHGCFNSKMLVSPYAPYENQYYKGCSAFPIEDDLGQGQTRNF